MNAPIADPVEQAMAEVAKLPQARFIKPEDIRAWILKVQEQEPARLAWHVRRLRGIGGSEIGAIVTARRGDYHPFTQASDVIRGKLMIDAPQGPTGDTARGVALEDPLRDLFRPWMKKHYNAEPADDVLQAVMNVVSKKNPWQVGNPDDAFWLPGKKLVMVDYKCPRPDVLAGYEVFGKPFDYICQLHHYTMLAIEAGYGDCIDQLCLTSLDSDKWEPAPYFLKFDQAIADEITEAGTHYWNTYVLQGRVPDIIEKPVSTVDDATLTEMVNKAGRILAISNNGYKQVKEVEELIMSYLGQNFFLGKPSVAIGCVDLLNDEIVDETRLASKLKLWGEPLDKYRLPDAPDPELMEKKLVELGINPKDFYTPSKKFDIPKIKARLKAAREDPGRYVREHVKVKLTPLRKGARGEQFIALRSEAAEHIKTFAEAAPAATAIADPLPGGRPVTPKP